MRSRSGGEIESDHGRTVRGVGGGRGSVDSCGSELSRGARTASTNGGNRRYTSGGVRERGGNGWGEGNLGVYDPTRRTQDSGQEARCVGGPLYSMSKDTDANTYHTKDLGSRGKT